jgi:MFS family permease
VTADGGKLRFLRAFRSPNYRLFFGGQLLSLTGLWMQRVAMGWLVYRLTDSPVALGTVEFVGQMPIFLLGLFAGPLLDRWELKRVISFCQFLAMGQALYLAFSTLNGTVTFARITAAAFFLGVINAFEMPARHSFVIHMVERRDDLAAAIAMNSVLFNSARIFGPSLGGVIIAALGEGPCFLLNALSYLSIIVALALMKTTPTRKTSGKRGYLADLAAGLNHAWAFLPLRRLLALLVVMSFAGFPYITLLPIFARDILGGDATTLGFLLGALGLGALVSALTLASRPGLAGLDRRTALAITLFGLALPAFALSRSLALSLVLIAVTVSCNTLIQSLVDDDKRSRIMSLYSMALLGLAPFGSLTAGFAARAFGARPTLLAGGLVCLAAGIAFLKGLASFRDKALPVLTERGLL